MNTVVQTRYRPQIARATPGLVADESGYDITTRLCATAAGIPFGVAVSPGPGDKTAVLGGAAFLGISVRDVTLDGGPLDPLIDARAPTDLYDFDRNMSIITRGRVWVVADADVAPGDPLFFDPVLGTLGNTNQGRAAYGYVSFTGQPAPNDTLTLGGTTVTFVAAGATGNQVNIGPTLGETIEDLADFLNASADANLTKAEYEAYPPSPGGEGEGSGANQLNIASKTVGTANNGFTLAKSGAAATVSGPTLTGGFGGTDASGEILFSAQPTSGRTVTLNGSAVTFGDGTGGTVAIGAALTNTMDNLVTALSASADAQISKCTYAAHGATGAHDGVVATYKTVGTGGNGFTLATNDPNGTVSSPTLSGGVDAAESAPDAWWVTSAEAGDLAMVVLSLQR